jgi:hypothetical protein
MNTSNSVPRVLGWLVGGLSLVYLVQALISFHLHQSIQFLIISYQMTVYHFFNFLTGWIDLSWFNLSDVERHFVVILAICQSALLNSSSRYANRHLFLVIAVVLFLLLDVIIFGLIPDEFIVTPIFVAILMMVLPFYLERSGDIRLQGYSTNFMGITSVFLVITSVNYVLTIV